VFKQLADSFAQLEEKGIENTTIVLATIGNSLFLLITEGVHTSLNIDRFTCVKQMKVYEDILNGWVEKPRQRPRIQVR